MPSHVTVSPAVHVLNDVYASFQGVLSGAASEFVAKVGASEPSQTVFVIETVRTTQVGAKLNDDAKTAFAKRR